MNRQANSRNSARRFSLPASIIIAASVVTLAAGCGVPATSIAIRNVADSTAKPANTPTAVAQQVTPVPAVAAATGAATAQAQAAATTAATESATQASAAATTAVTVAATAAPTTAAVAATTAATSAATAQAGVSPTATGFMLNDVLFGTQAATTAATAATTSAAATTAATTVATTAATTAAATAPAANAGGATAATAAAAAGTQAANAGGAKLKGDPKRGETIFNGVGTCNTCHDYKQGIQIVGPSQKGLATRAGTRKPGMSAEDYIRESILKPNAYIVQGFPSGVMPQNFGQILTPQQIEDLVAFLLTLK